MAKLTLQGDARGAVRAINDLNRALDKTEDELEDATKAATRTERAARRIAEQADPQRRYNRQIDELAKLTRQGAVSMEDASTVAQRYGDRLERAGRAGRKAFGPEAGQALATYVTGFANLGSLVQQVTAYFTDMEAAAQRAADISVQTLGALGELQQVSATPEEFQRNVGAARSLIRRGIFGPEQQGAAFDTMFNLISAGFSEQDRERIFQLAEQRQIRPEGLTTFGGNVARFQNIFGEAAGSLEQVLDTIIATSNTTQLTATQTAQAFTNFATEARSLGFGVAETAAAFTTVESQAPSGEIAATRLRSLFSQLETRGLARGTLTETLAGIQTRLSAGERLSDIIPEIRARTGLRNLLDQGQFFQEQIGAIGEAGGALSQRDFLEADPRARAAQLRAASEGRLFDETAATDEIRENLWAAYRAERVAAARRGFWGRPNAWLRGMQFDIEDFFGAEDIALRQALADPNISQGLRLEISDYLQQLIDSTERNTSPSGRQE